MAKRKITDQVQITARMREPLRAKLEKAAKETGDSMNSQICSRLERSFREDEIMSELREIRALIDGGGR